MFVDAVRSLRSSPGVTLFILVILTSTIAAATVTFSVVDAVVLRPLPFERPDDLVAIDHQRGDRVMSQARALSALQFLALRERTDAVETMAAVARAQQVLQTGGEPERIGSARVTASLFEVLRTKPLMGDVFDASREVAGNDRVAVISHGLWRRHFASDSGVVGRTLQVAGGSLVVLAVMPEGFSYPMFDDRLTHIWTPYVIPEPERQTGQQSAYLHVVGRLRAGASLVEAQTQADDVRKALAGTDADRYPPSGRFSVTTLDEAVLGPVRGWMVLVLVAVGLLLIVACANVANLLLTRAIDRARELSIRAALGATRTRLVTALLLESLILSLCAVALALLVASWGVGAARASLPPGIARAPNIVLDLRVFGAAVIGGVFTALLFGVIPALQASRGDLVAALKHGASTVAAGGGRWRGAVLVAEIALASVLLVATTLFVSSFVRLTRTDLGFDRANLLVADAPRGLQGTVSDFAQRLESISGVTAVGGAAAGSPPLVMAGFGGGASATRLQRPDAPAGEFVVAEFNRVSPRYFAAAAIPVLGGRVFGDGEGLASAAVVLDEHAARLLFGDRDPLGREVISHGSNRVTVIGVVGHVSTRGPEADSGAQAYFPGPPTAGSYAFLIRTTQREVNVIPAIQGAIAALAAPGSQPPLIRPVEDAFRNITARRRFGATSMALFGALALLIGATGVYGVMSSLVAQRTREIGVRLALGATVSQIVRAVLGPMARYVALGLALGLPIAWLVTRTSAALFFQVRPTDAWVYLVVAAVLGGVGLTAALVPARRASRVDPLTALRAE
jgi:putative ABC transport system permease protein